MVDRKVAIGIGNVKIGYVCDMCAGVYVKKQGAIPVADHSDWGPVEDFW
jgi:hypothetical protein